jgi:uncharacterized iron-regulated protein
MTGCSGQSCHPRVGTSFLVLFCAILCLSPFQIVWAQDGKRQTPYPIIERATGQILTVETLLTHMAGKRYVIVGERHGFAPHQQRHVFLIQALADQGRYPSLVLEMLNPQQEPALRAFRSANPEYAMPLGQHLRWWESGWPAWSYYAALFEAAFAAKLDIVAGEAPSEQRSQDHPAPVATGWIAALDRAHCGKRPPAELVDLARRQIARDKAMAEAMQGHAGPDGALLIAGSTHADPVHGVPAWLPAEKTLTIVLKPLVIGQSPAQALAGMSADIVWFTPSDPSARACP